MKRTAILGTAFFLLAGLSVRAGESGRLEVLNANSYVRFATGLRTPELATAVGGLVTPTWGKDGKSKPEEIDIPAAPADWMQPEFDDAGWFRGRAPFEMWNYGYEGYPGLRSSVHHLILARAKFVVDDPAKVNDLRLSLAYIGGVVVYVNGKEAARGHLPAGALKPETPAEAYKDDPYTDAEGKRFKIPVGADKSCSRAIKAEKEADAARLASRWRKLEGVAIPQQLLRKGVNVLAVENHRSPIHEAQWKTPRQQGGLWAYIGLGALGLSAAPGSAVAANVDRPKGFQVWGCALEAAVSPGNVTADAEWVRVQIGESYGDPGESPRLAISAARNGVFSGKLAVNSSETVKGLQVEAGELKAAGAKGTIPAGAVRIRYARPAAPQYDQVSLKVDSGKFDALLDSPPAAAPLILVWASVRVPGDAPAGLYEGTLTVKAEGQGPVTVPVRLTVYGWSLPDPKDSRIHTLGFMSPESVAKHYGLPLWSEKHFEYMGKSMALMSELRSRTLLVNLAINWYWHNSNEESMIRWIKQPDGTYKHDFTIFDKYLDLAAKNLGKPLPLRLNCWGDWRKNDKDGKFFWYGPKSVSLLDPASGKVEPLEMPPLDSPDFIPFWKPVLDEARKKIEARGWFDATCLGHNAYCTPPVPAVVSMAKKIWPDGAWGLTTHNQGLGPIPAVEKGESMPCRFSEVVWTEPSMRIGGPGEFLKPRAGVWCATSRGLHGDASPLIVLRNVAEGMVWKGPDGVGQFGADSFQIKNPKGGYYYLGNDRGGLGPQCSTLSILAPGPDGPVATERYEMFREGLETGEAIILLERAKAGNKLSGDLAARVDRLLGDRLRLRLAEHFLCGSWNGDDYRVLMSQVVPWTAKLFALCAEVEAIGGKGAK